jgi:hypothetical protein
VGSRKESLKLYGNGNPQTLQTMKGQHSPEPKTPLLRQYETTNRSSYLSLPELKGATPVALSYSEKK